VANLNQAHSSPPTSALRAASERWHHVRESLLQRTAREIEEIELGDRREYSDLAVFTFYLAAEQNAPEAFPILLRLLAVEDPHIQERFGEVFADDMPILLSDCYPGDRAMEDLEALLGNASLPVASRRAVLDCLEILASQQRLSTSRLRALVERLADGGLEPAQPRLWTALTELCLAGGLHEFAPVALEAHRRGWIEPASISAQVLEQAFARAREGSRDPLQGTLTIRSAVEEVEAWDWDRTTGRRPAARRSSV